MTVSYKITGMPRNVYQRTVRKLSEDDNFPAEGNLLHYAAEHEGEFFVINAWESEESAEAFYDAFRAASEEFAAIGFSDNGAPVEITKTDLATLYSVENDILNYKVQPFDVEREEGALSYLANYFGVSVEELAELNDIEDPDMIQVDQIIRIR